MLAADALLGLAAALLVLAQAVLLAQVSARAFGGASLAEVRVPLALFCAAAVGRAAAAWGFEVVGRRAATDVLAALRLDVVERRLRGGHDVSASADVATLAVTGVDALEATFARYLPQVVLAVVVPVAVLVLVAAVDPLSAGIMLLTLPLVPVFMWLIGRYTEQRARERWAALSQLATHFLDVVRGLPTLRAFNRGQAQTARIGEMTDRYRRATMGTLRVAFLSGAVLELAATLGIALIAVTVGVRLAAGAVGFEAALVVLVLAPELYLPLRNLASQYHASADGRAVSQRLLDVVDAPVEAGNGSIPAPSPRAATVGLEGVCFSYAGRGGPALDGVDLELRPRETWRSSARAAPGRAPLHRCSSASERPIAAWCESGRWTSGRASSPGGGRGWPGFRNARPSSAAPSPTTSDSVLPRPTPARCTRLLRSSVQTTSSGRCETATRPSSAMVDGRCRPASSNGSRSRVRSCAMPS